MGPVKILRLEESQIDPGLQALIGQLLGRSFPGYPEGRTYFMQLPSFRLLSVLEDGTIAGHLAVEHRMISVGGIPFRIFGIADLCVDPAFQTQKTGTGLLQALDSESRDAWVDFIVLVASRRDIYEENGFESVNNPCRYVSIRDHQTNGVVQESLGGDLMVKTLGSKKWRDGLVDFMGTIF